MNPTIFQAVVELLSTKFDVPRENVTPQAELQSLGLDSLSLMEFVFAIEDQFSLRIPEERLDPRQAQLTVADLCQALEENLAPRAAGATAAAA